MNDPGLWVLYIYLALIGGALIYERIRRWRRNRHTDPGQINDTNPDHQPGPRDAIYHDLEATYRLPAARRTP